MGSFAFLTGYTPNLMTVLAFGGVSIRGFDVSIRACGVSIRVESQHSIFHRSGRAVCQMLISFAPRRQPN